MFINILVVGKGYNKNYYESDGADEMYCICVICQVDVPHYQPIIPKTYSTKLAKYGTS